MLVARSWINAARLRRLVRGPRQSRPIREDLIRKYARGRSFVDVGCMWNVDGAYAFLAESSGATTVTGVDLLDESEAFLAEKRRRGSQVRFVKGDLHDFQTRDAVGHHDVVYSSGVLYHTPSPMQTLEDLGSITDDMLIIGTATIPEVPGLEAACVFYPGLSAAGKKVYEAAPRRTPRVGITTPFDFDDIYANWWWGMTPSALCGMIRVSGFEIVECVSIPFFACVVARRQHPSVTAGPPAS